MTTTVDAPSRARIPARTLRTDGWWIPPVLTALGLTLFVGYATWAALVNTDYSWEPYLSPFYSPCLATSCTAHGAPTVPIFGDWWIISPAIIVLIVPLGFRVTCYYYRKAYYRAFWAAPPACAVAEPHGKYRGETRLPLVIQNIHRYFLYLGLILNAILTYDAVVAFRDHQGAWGHMGLGTLVLLVNAGLLWLYSLSCHSCRHVLGGRLRHFSKHPIRYRIWTLVSELNSRHMLYAWLSLFWVGFADLYVRLVASGMISDPRFF